jgi:hypothetical protein
MTYELHPLCSLFPRLTGAEFDALQDDIKANGLRSPIVLHEGMILDGGNRYRACIEAGVEPTFAQFSGGNLVAFVLSANLHRRHMSPGQQTAIVASAQDWAKAQPRGGDRRSDQSATLHLDRAVDRAAAAGASLRTQKMADKVAKADPVLAKRVAHGEISLPAAVRQVTSTRPPAVAPAVAAVVAPVEPEADEASEDPMAMLEEAHTEVEKLTALLQAAEADDLKAEAIKWRKLYEHAQREQGVAMDHAHEAKKREKWSMDQLRRCGRAVGEEDPTKIARAVERAVKQGAAA